MASLRTFIAALRTGETRTTKALEEVLVRRRGAEAEEVIAALHHRGALKAPLQTPLRRAVKKAPLPDRFIDRCIDAWPDAQKEQARRAMAKAIDDGHRLQFRWGLTAGKGYETEITHAGNRVTITALSPRSTLRVSDNDIDVAPRQPARKRDRR
jgi:hypothetical protein